MCDFFVCFDIEIDVIVVVVDDDERFEAYALIRRGLFLNRVNFYNFIFKFFIDEVFNDLVFFDW